MSKYILTNDDGKLDIAPLDDYKDNNEADDLVKRRKEDVLQTIAEWLKFEADFQIHD